MLVRRRLSALAGAGVFAMACAGGGQEHAAGDPAPLNELRTKYQSTYNGGDASALAALYTDDAISLPDHHAALQGKAAIQQYFQALFSQYKVTIAFMPGDLDIAGALAHEHGSYTISVTPKAGGETVKDDGKYVMIFKRGADGVWKLHHDMDNSNRMPEMPGPAEHR